jgi:hypothetical protein
MRTQQRPIQNKLAIMNLATGDKSTIDNIKSFASSADGKFLLMRRYAPTPRSRRPTRTRQAAAGRARSRRVRALRRRPTNRTRPASRSPSAIWRPAPDDIRQRRRNGLA